CNKCGKPTWKGCGQHIEQALRDVPKDERCQSGTDSCAKRVAPVKKN
ncbi:unnamed protein product, partial [Rotaria sordida]